MQLGDLVLNMKTGKIVRFNTAMRKDNLIDLSDSNDPFVQWISGEWRNRWQDATVVCLGSGPHTTQEQLDWVRVKHANGECKVIAVNRSYEQAPFADVLFAKDWPWWDGYIEAVGGFAGEKWTASIDAARKYGLSYAQYQRGASDHTLGKNQLKDENSGHQAINLAYLFGASKIILLGYEMNPTVEKIHFFGLHDESNGLENPTHDVFKGWIKKMNILARSMPIPVFNCSINTAITGFKQAKIQEVLP